MLPLLSLGLTIFVGAVFGWLKRQARECGIPRAQCGAVTFIQRFGSALNLTPHFYLVAFDGRISETKVVGEFAGHAPTGRSFTLRGCGFFQIVDGKIRSQRGYWDRATWFNQLGLPVD